MTEFTWSRWDGYEVSTKGDARFSAFVAKLLDGRSIEQHYQCDVKGYDPGGTDWRKGKGKNPLVHYEDDGLWQAYLSLWVLWADRNPALIEELRAYASMKNRMLSDRFATTPINQAHALAVILNRTKPCTLISLPSPSS